MLKVLLGSQMQEVDRQAIEKLKIPGILLMENAGRTVCDEILNIIAETDDYSASVLVICGKGNNGGDGYVAARHLIENQIQTTVISLFRSDSLTGSALINHDILENFTEIVYFDEIDIEKLQDLILASDFVVDAMLGTGLNSEVKGLIKEVTAAINEYSEGTVISVDIPSGVNADTGEVLGTAVIADFTVTFHALKQGLVNYPGADYAGEIVVAPIGIPESLTEGNGFNTMLITSNYVHSILPLRKSDGHKGTFGKVFNVAGSIGMTGAAYMSSLASLKSGAGYSALATPQSAVPVVASMAPEIVCIPLEETKENAISEKALAKALDNSKDARIFLLGCGIGTSEETVSFVAQFVQQLTDRGANLIVDADGLNCLALKQEVILPANSIITPHPKELSRLINIPVENILKDRIRYAREAAERFNTIVVLKSANTVIAEPNGNIYINQTGNSGLATAGSGDILAGMIAGFAAQGAELRDAAILGVYLHGLAADLAVEELTEYSLVASDLLDYIPAAIKEI
jgi:NAD(P)H-hydrate epimerase